MQKLTEQLNHRRKTLGMPYQVLADRAGVGISTVQRALSGKGNVCLKTLSAIADVLGCEITLQPTQSVTELLERQAETKADLLVSLTQGSAALESQTVDERTITEAKRMTVHRLMAASKRRLWS